MGGVGVSQDRSWRRSGSALPPAPSGSDRPRPAPPTCWAFRFPWRVAWGVEHHTHAAGRGGHGRAALGVEGVWEMPAGPPAADQDLVTWPVTSQVLPAVIHIIRRCIVWPARPVRSHLLTLASVRNSVGRAPRYHSTCVSVQESVGGLSPPQSNMADSGKSKSASPSSRAVPGRCGKARLGGRGRTWVTCLLGPARPPGMQWLLLLLMVGVMGGCVIVVIVNGVGGDH